MGCRAVIFGLGADDAQRLLAAAGEDGAVMGLIEEIEERWDRDALVDLDNSWDAAIFTVDQ
jgi:hypothetical protein